MTVNDIMKEVAALGFESEIEGSDSFFTSLRRAVDMLYRDRELYRTKSFFQSIPSPSYFEEVIFSPGGEAIERELTQGAYSFYISGSAECTLKSEDGATVFSCRDGERRAGYVDSDTVLTLHSDLPFTVHRFSHFRNLLAKSEEDIPTGKRYREYSLRSLFPDFMSAVGEAKDGEGHSISGAAISTDSLIMPSSYVGEVRITYRAAPPEIDRNNTDADIKLPRDSEHLVALLVASFMWLDDDSEKAYYYASLYREGINALKRSRERQGSTAFHDVTGWAK